LQIGGLAQRNAQDAIIRRSRTRYRIACTSAHGALSRMPSAGTPSQLHRPDHGHFDDHLPGGGAADPSSGPSPRCWRRPTSCRHRCSRCCAA